MVKWKDEKMVEHKCFGDDLLLDLTGFGMPKEQFTAYQIVGRSRLRDSIGKDASADDDVLEFPEDT